jgi:hypothetical protein
MKDSEPKVTLEELLRLKRAERPPAEFWSRFDSEMRAKQLAAIVVRRPLWDGISRIFAAVYRNHLPFGAAAAVALTWAGVHFAGGPSLTVRTTSARADESTASAKVDAPAALTATRSVRPTEKVEIDVSVKAAPSRQPVVASNPSHLTKVPTDAQPESIAATPFADGIAVSLADFRSTDSDLSKRDVFGSDREFEAPAAPGRQPAAEPLAQVDPSGERLERLLAPALPAYSSYSARTLVNDRMKQKAADDRMYESMDRYGSGGMSLEFRF